MRDQRVKKIAISGLLIAIGLLIPMFSPVKLVLEPASFTLASHVAIFIAIFISPAVAVSVAAGTAIGFLLGGFPIIIVFRAATHIIFALLGSLYIYKRKDSLSGVNLRIFSLCVALIHAFCEFVVVSFFYFEGNISPAHFEQGFAMSVLLLVGLGTVIHSMIDFEIAHLILLPLKKTEFIK